jgi:hypothetical protein
MSEPETGRRYWSCCLHCGMSWQNELYVSVICVECFYLQVPPSQRDQEWLDDIANCPICNP